MQDNLVMCTVCVLPETFPGISFDDHGVCNFCRQYEADRSRHIEDKARYAAKFDELLATLGRGGGRRYDILMAYSGGKDSTYTLALLHRKHGLKVLALSFDNGFVSPRARENIGRVTDALSVDHIFFKPRWDMLRAIFFAASKQELFSRKTLERASTICTACIGLVKATCLKTAIELEIPMIGYGWSPGQAPVQSSIMRTNPALFKMTQAALLAPLEKSIGEGVSDYFLGEKHFERPERFPWNVHPLAWEPYDEQMIIAEIGLMGWLPPEDTDPNSTNCLLNAYANEIHLARYGFHPYIWEIANMVREGVMSRMDGLHKFGEPVPDSWIAPVRTRLGLA